MPRTISRKRKRAEGTDAILEHYRYMAEALAKMFSPVLETVVHDLRNPDHSIIAIYNGHVTGRKVGDPATDLGRRLLKGEFPDVVIGYDNESPTGAKLKSSSIAIRDGRGRLIGVMGLNLDISYFQQFVKFLEQFVSGQKSEYVPEAEHFEVSSPSEDIRDAIDRFILSRNWNSRKLSTSEKRELVEHVYREGYFKHRGAVSIIARELGVTRATVYNYKNDFLKRVGHRNSAAAV